MLTHRQHQQLTTNRGIPRASFDVLKIIFHCVVPALFTAATSLQFQKERALPFFISATGTYTII